MLRNIAAAAMLAVAGGIAVPGIIMAVPASANVCCYVQEEDPNGSGSYYMSDTYPGQPVNLTSIRETYYIETLPADFGGHTFFLYQDSKNYCLTALPPGQHQPSDVGSQPCDSASSAQRWRWIASGSWHYLSNLHFGQNAVDAFAVTGCAVNGGCSDVVINGYQFLWGVFSG